MNNNLRTENLVRYNKEELIELIQEAIDYTKDDNFDADDALHGALEQIEAVVYVLKNCDYEGKEK